jgi:hypothetical protein
VQQRHQRNLHFPGTVHQVGYEVITVAGIGKDGLGFFWFSKSMAFSSIVILPVR